MWFRPSMTCHDSGHPESKRPRAQHRVPTLSNPGTKSRGPASKSPATFPDDPLSRSRLFDADFYYRSSCVGGINGCCSRRSSMAANFLSMEFSRSLWVRGASGVGTGWQRRNEGEATEGGCSMRSPPGFQGSGWVRNISIRWGKFSGSKSRF